jgi:hypothetical protein
MRSETEGIRLGAVKEAFDRLLGRAPLSVDSTSTKYEQSVQKLYLDAVIRANAEPPPVRDGIAMPDGDSADTEW